MIKNPLFIAAALCVSSLLSAQTTELISGTILEHFKPVKMWQLAGEVSAVDGKSEFTVQDGATVLYNGAKRRKAPYLYSLAEFGDMAVSIEFMVPKGSNAGVYFFGRYEIQILDSYGKQQVSFSDLGGVYQRWRLPKEAEAFGGQQGYEGVAPRVNAAKAPGEWQQMDIVFRAPRFGPDGKKTEHARFLSVHVNGELVQENVEVTGPTRAAPETGDVARGSIVIQGDHGPVAIRSLRVTSLNLNEGTAVATAEPFTPDWESLNQHNAAPEWFQDAKLGVYFHWGLYSIPAIGGEWYPRWMYTPGIKGRGQWVYDYHQKNYGPDFQYHDFIPQWAAPHFDAAEWVTLFEEMGAKYVGALAEHHDGFSLWDSEVNPWNSTDMGPQVDIVGALQREAEKRDLKFMATFHHGFHMMYYPKPENSFPRPQSNYNMVEEAGFTYPKGGDFDKLYGNMSMEDASAYWLAKLKEVVDQYCPDYMWFDFGQKFISEAQRQEFLAYYFNKAEAVGKEVMVNTKGTFFPTDLAIVNIERATFPEITDYTWASDFKLGPNWSFNQTNRTAVDPQQLIRILAEIVSKNGTMILNVSPMADGNLPEEQVASMKAIGAWLKLYGEAIYKTRPFVVFGEGVTDIKPDMDFEWNTRNMIRTGLWELNAGDIRYTRKGDVVYAIQLGWPGSGKRVLMESFAQEAKDLEIKTLSVLGSDEAILWERTSQGLVVHTPSQQPAETNAALVYKIELK